ncbi:MAG TPA: rod shape-determining protein RodA [Gammaproteobacteria bacterium]|jgi:rod shape determining protein RodA|nr:rod shape-determining protein RodA [Gammaproteobacteria bacterium]HIK72642.1 rod shape-determining protein RodA [Gammaproteobacteria bacterium]
MSNRPLDYNLNKPFSSSRFSLSLIFKDNILVFSVLVVLGFGLFMLYSASGQSESMVLRQLAYAVLGFLGMLIIAQLSSVAYQNILINLYWIGLIMLIYVLIFPDDSQVTKRWIDLGLFSFQPSEVIRLILPLSIAAFLTRKELKPKYSEWFISLMAVLLVSFLIYKQPDLGTALIVFASGFLPIFLTGFPVLIIILSLILIGIFSPFIYAGLSLYQQQRIMTFFDPNADPLGTGWNIAQSKTAIGSGGYFGKGYLSGTQSQLDFIPESHSDFIFAVIAEELGLLGIILLFLAYAIIIYRIFFIAFRSETIFGRLASASIGFIFLIFILINISMVVGIIPVVGVPLPLVSQGGTSLATHLLAFGFVLSVKKRSGW